MSAVVEQATELWTHSSMSTFMNCPRRGHYRYDLHLVPVVEHKARPIGSAFHKAMETGRADDGLALFDRLMPMPNDQSEMDRWLNDRAIVEGLARGGLANWARHQGGQREVQFRVPIVNPDTGRPSRSFLLAGKIDAIVDVNGVWHLEEYKSASQINTVYVDRLSLDTQVTLYLYAARRMWGIDVHNVIYRVGRKPSIQQRKGETAAQYRERLLSDYLVDRPDFYFMEFALERTEAQLAEFERDLWVQTQRHLQDRRLNFHPKNTSRCSEYGGCPYMPLCLGRPDAEALYKTRAPHSELVEEDEPDA